MALDPKIKTIVIDDMMTMKKIITKILKSIGFTNIDEADDGATAWPMIEEAAKNGVKVVQAGVSNFVVKLFTPATLKGKIAKIFD